MLIDTPLSPERRRTYCAEEYSPTSSGISVNREHHTYAGGTAHANTAPTLSNVHVYMTLSMVRERYITSS